MIIGWAFFNVYAGCFECAIQHIWGKSAQLVNKTTNTETVLHKMEKTWPS